MSRLDFNMARHAQHRRECRSDECPICDYRDEPELPSAADQDAWSGRFEDAEEYWRWSA